METVNLHVFDITQIPPENDLSASSSVVTSSGAKDRICQYLVREDRCRCLAGELLLRHLLSDAPVRRKDASGRSIKPCAPKALFNLSHDEDFVVLASSAALSVGVDVMKVKVSSSSLSIEGMLQNLRSIFSLSEWGYIHTASTDQRLHRFYQLWTAKEAYVKCLGTGLYVEPQDLELGGFEDRKSESEDLRLHVRQRVNEFSSTQFAIRTYSHLIPGYVVAVCGGPVALCDPSWTNFMDLNLPTPHCPITDVSLGDVSFHTLGELLHSEPP